MILPVNFEIPRQEQAWLNLQELPVAVLDGFQPGLWQAFKKTYEHTLFMYALGT